jgi:hypothetical protein
MCRNVTYKDEDGEVHDESRSRRDLDGKAVSVFSDNRCTVISMFNPYF